MAKKEKKEKKKKIKIPLTAKQIAIIMAIICLVSFLYKFTIGIMSLSMVLMIAAIPTLFVFICKFLYAKNMNQTEKQKLRSYLFMLVATAAFSTLFILFSTLKVGGIDITHENTLNGWIGILFIFFIIAMFVLSIINLKGALRKDDLVVMGIKEISFVSALADAVMINAFIYRVILKYLEPYIPFYSYVNRYFPLAVAILMAIVPFLMLRRYLRYRKQMKENAAKEEGAVNEESEAIIEDNSAKTAEM